jgi:hypothetical protein
MRRRSKPLRIIAATMGLVLAAAIGASVVGRLQDSSEVAAAPATLERIARKNDAAAINAAAAMAARSEAQARATEKANGS